MTGPRFPFEADFDADADAVARGPIDRRDLVLSLVLGLLGAITVGIAGAVVAVELALSSSPSDLPPIVLTGGGPVVCWLAGALVALTRLVRRRHRAWIAPLGAIAGAIVLGAVGLLWWVRVVGIA